ncbi:MsnO8 family LLM class oxidoreductase [Pseudooceanicola sp. GBMRC 2024]|uniref:MsnO8 family LLM class oxidoreductase n=1 Tax=Pseudooceanicola albus TaxID=2692189 RepID=A0A6L7G1G0_9RHOB|nr:MsnO8 family LLM class oxidoreductase [Pseudooceanicola albus]MXN17759.1 MsnO8 family LLM class oxidoreductase [Pseudooceanicola albus]
MKLSILEQSTLSEAGSGAEAIRNTLRVARLADELGYERLWLSEHHNLPILQGSAPEVLLAALGAATRRIRIGSGGIMLPNFSAYKVAEVFRVLEALYPGRVDCGVGRASGGNRAATALLAASGRPEFPAQLAELQHFLQDADPRAVATPVTPAAPPLWLLSAGSHPDSGRLAAERGMGLAVALFINPDATRVAVERYRAAFRPSPEMPEPRVLLALNLVTAATPARLARVQKASDHFRLMRDSGHYPSAVPAPQTLERIRFTPDQQAYLARISNREVSGLPGEVAEKVAARLAAYDADEAMLAMMTHDLDDKLEALRLLADHVMGVKADA